ncbi:CRTAC1 family protein [Rhodobacter sp. HX-7-19]|uniref:CRTAC1 family protein n=1 Tax=Paragemmobacter kunshanensis TaxID=2583234 RepID=A0A6M1TZ59_9RHOB|nr:CRTAC1 family protein [Rhodobacter kunshanensis]NGQ91532.1 CRTAC1 family protein [Rhodobacter kunshanensis]
MRRALLLLALAAAAPARAQDPAIPSFAEETAPAGFTHAFTGEWEFMVGGGIAVFDCNGDTRPDIFAAGGTAPAALFVNDSAPAGPLAFTPTPSGLEETSVSGAYPLDIDGDGILDLALLRVGQDRLMRGLGDCRFEDASAAWGFDGLDLWSTAFAATWEQGASLPTLAIGTYIDRAQEAFPWGNCTPNHLYRPKTDGSGYDAPLPLTPGFCALSILFTDWDRQGTPDLRVSNDREYYKGGQEQLWHVEPGQPPRLFTEAEGWQRLRIWGMGIAQEDLNFDGFPEFFLTSMADNKLQTLAEIPPQGAPLPRYRDIALKSGVTAHRPYTGGDLRPSTAWHAQFGDVNNDGLPDLYVVKGNVWAMPDFAEDDPNNLLLQRPDGTFLESGDRSGVASMAQGRGGALVDLNADGLLDMIALNRNEPAQIWRNTTASPANWIALDLSLPGPNRNAIGAWIELRRPDGRIHSREVQVGGGHVGGILVPQHFGLGPATSAEIRILWPDGTAGDWQTLAANAVWRLEPGRAPVAVTAPN